MIYLISDLDAPGGRCHPEYWNTQPYMLSVRLHYGFAALEAEGVFPEQEFSWGDPRRSEGQRAAIVKRETGTRW